MSDIIKAVEAGGLVTISQLIEYAKELELAGREKDSMAVFRQLMANEPSEAMACQYAAALCRLGERDRQGVEDLIAKYPGCDFLKAAKSEMALNDGEYQTGFGLCQYRWAASSNGSYRERIKLPTWDGGSLKGRLIVVSEQGIGEEILYSSSFGLIPPAIISADLRLQPILARSFPQHIFVDRTAIHHYHGEAVIEAMDLCRIFCRQGNGRSWLRPDQQKVMAYRKALNEAFPGRKLVGLSWWSARKGLSLSKSIPIQDLMPFMTDDRLAVINVQYGDCLDDTNHVANNGGSMFAIGGIELTQDQDELAALIGALDVVVTCSNSVAHLAGALGVRTILLAPSRFLLWYWTRTGNKTPWYPSIEIIRNTSGWKSTVDEALRII